MNTCTAHNPTTVLASRCVVLLFSISAVGCYSDRLPEEVQHLGVPRVEAIKIEPLEPVTLKPATSVKVPLRLARNGNEGPIDLSLSKIPEGVDVTLAEQMPAEQSEVEIELVGTAALGDRSSSATLTVFLTMGGSTLKVPLALELPAVARPTFVAPLPVFLQPGNEVDVQVPIERNGYAEPITLEPLAFPEGVTCTMPEEPVEGSNVLIHLAVAEDAAEARLAPSLQTTVYGREVAVPVVVNITRRPFALDEMPLVTLSAGTTAEATLPVTRDSMESLSRLVTGGISALTGVNLAADRFNGAIEVVARHLPDQISITPTHVHTGGDACELTVEADAEATPGLYLIPLEATADHLEAAGLLALRVTDQTTEPGKLPEAIVEAMASRPRRRRGGVAGRSSAESKRLLGNLYGATPEAEKAVQQAVAWLAAAQADDGSWQAQTSTAGMGEDGGDPLAQEPAANPSMTTGSKATATALALLPFLAEGVTYEPASATAVWLEDYPETVKAALLWLGNAGSSANPQSVSDTPQPLAAQAGIPNQPDLSGFDLAVTVASEVSELTGDRVLKQNAVLVAKELVRRQLPDGTWQADGQANSLTAAQGFLALHIAKACGVNASASGFRRAEKYFTEMASGPAEAPQSRYGLTAGGPVDPTATAAALLAWQYDEQPADSPDQIAGAEYLATIVPSLSAESFDQPVDYLLYAGAVLRNLEGERFDRWQAQVVSFLTRTQQRDGEEAGSWDPALFAGGTDRLRTTVLATLCLQNAYRYLPLYRE